MSSPFPTIGTIGGIPAHGGWSAAFVAPNGQPFIITAPNSESLRSACEALGIKLDMPHEMRGVMILDRRMVSESDLYKLAPVEEVALNHDGSQDPIDNAGPPSVEEANADAPGEAERLAHMVRGREIEDY